MLSALILNVLAHFTSKSCEIKQNEGSKEEFEMFYDELPLVLTDLACGCCQTH